MLRFIDGGLLPHVLQGFFEFFLRLFPHLLVLGMVLDIAQLLDRSCILLLALLLEVLLVEFLVFKGLGQLRDLLLCRLLYFLFRFGLRVAFRLRASTVLFVLDKGGFLLGALGVIALRVLWCRRLLRAGDLFGLNPLALTLWLRRVFTLRFAGSAGLGRPFRTRVLTLRFSRFLGSVVPFGVFLPGFLLSLARAAVLALGRLGGVGRLAVFGF